MGTLDWLIEITDPAPFELRDNTRFRPRPNQPAQIQIMGPHSLDVHEIRDIALRGVALYLRPDIRAPQIGSRVELILTLPGERPFLACGLVRHRTQVEADRPFLGIEFTALEARRREQLRNYLESGTAQRIT
ncbi:MAG: PilZ domain-containing protein [Myxococcota bacterium]